MEMEIIFHSPIPSNQAREIDGRSPHRICGSASVPFRLWDQPSDNQARMALQQPDLAALARHIGHFVWEAYS